MATNTLYLAERYLDFGFVPIPLRPVSAYPTSIPLSRRKGPAGKDWCSATLDDALQRVKSARAAFGNGPMNVGILCGKPSGIVVVDVDVKGEGLATWEALEKKYGPTKTFRVRTGGGGLHLYFKYCPLRTTVGLLYDGKKVGIDVRSDRSQVVGPGSIHPSTGVRYEIIGGYEDKKPVLEDVPPWFCKVFQYCKYDYPNFGATE